MIEPAKSHDVPNHLVATESGRSSRLHSPTASFGICGGLARPSLLSLHLCTVVVRAGTDRGKCQSYAHSSEMAKRNSAL